MYWPVKNNRIFWKVCIVNNEVVAVSKRIPPFIIGDGLKNIGICVGIISVVLFPAGIMTAFPRSCVFSVSCYFRVTSTGQWSDPKISV